MADRYVKRCSTSLITREMQIKTTMRCHIVPIRMAIIKDKREQVLVKGEPLYTVGGDVNWYSHCRKQCGCSSKIMNGVSSNPTSRYISKGNEISISKRYLHSHV